MLREMELGEEVKLFGKVEWEDFCLLVVYLHLVLVSKLRQVSKLMLEDRPVRREGELRDLVDVCRSNNWWCGDKGAWEANCFQEGQVIDIFLLESFVSLVAEWQGAFLEGTRIRAFNTR